MTSIVVPAQKHFAGTLRTYSILGPISSDEVPRYWTWVSCIYLGSYIRCRGLSALLVQCVFLGVLMASKAPGPRTHILTQVGHL